MALRVGAFLSVALFLAQVVPALGKVRFLRAESAFLQPAVQQANSCQQCCCRESFSSRGMYAGIHTPRGSGRPRSSVPLLSMGPPQSVTSESVRCVSCSAPYHRDKNKEQGVCHSEQHRVPVPCQDGVFNRKALSGGEFFLFKCMFGASSMEEKKQPCVV